MKPAIIIDFVGIDNGKHTLNSIDMSDINKLLKEHLPNSLGVNVEIPADAKQAKIRELSKTIYNAAFFFSKPSLIKPNKDLEWTAVATRAGKLPEDKANQIIGYIEKHATDASKTLHPIQADEIKLLLEDVDKAVKAAQEYLKVYIDKDNKMVAAPEYYVKASDVVRDAEGKRKNKTQ